MQRQRRRRHFAYRPPPILSVRCRDTVIVMRWTTERQSKAVCVFYLLLRSRGHEEELSFCLSVPYRTRMTVRNPTNFWQTCARIRGHTATYANARARPKCIKLFDGRRCRRHRRRRRRSRCVWVFCIFLFFVVNKIRKWVLANSGSRVELRGVNRTECVTWHIKATRLDRRRRIHCSVIYNP